TQVKINVDIDDKYKDTQITIQANEWSPEIQRLIDFINQQKPDRLFGVDGEQTVLLDPNEIDFFHVENRKTYAQMKQRHMEVRMKLFEVEESFASIGFMRLSKSVIGNINRIKRIELSFNGNLCVYFQSGNNEYISSKYVSAVKNRLESGGNHHDI